MALRKSLILRRPWSGRLEGRIALVQLNFNSVTPRKRGPALSLLSPHLPRRKLAPLDSRFRGNDEFNRTISCHTMTGSSS